MPSYEVSGNKCILLLFRVFNLLFLLEGLVIIALGIWLWAELKYTNVFALIFICLGVLEFLLSIMGCKIQKSYYRLKIYIIVLLVIFLAQFITSILAITMKDKLIDLAGEHQGEISQEELERFKTLIEDNVSIALYASISAVVVQFFCLVLSWRYSRSLVSRNIGENDEYRNLFEDDAGRKISLQEKQELNKTKARDNYNEKRAMYEQKYGVKLDGSRR